MLNKEELGKIFSKYAGAEVRMKKEDASYATARGWKVPAILISPANDRDPVLTAIVREAEKHDLKVHFSLDKNEVVAGRNLLRVNIEEDDEGKHRVANNFRLG